jgi:very-short-patch-repair endonuclease
VEHNLLKQRARTLRKNMTVAEKKLWQHLRYKQLSNIRFRRQVFLGKYIADFASLEPKIIIEVDGSQHFDQVNYDEKRTAYFVSLGYVVRRYWNNVVLSDIDSVLKDIWNVCFKIPPSAYRHLPPEGGRRSNVPSEE